MPVNTYVLEVTVGGNFYRGYGEDTFTVYDPSLGFTTGGGWFFWPGTRDRTNFGFVMKYGAKGSQPRGSVLVIRHMPNGSIHRLKSNALTALSLGQGTTPLGVIGWATFTGKATYLAPGMTDAVGSYSYTVYVEDRNEPGTGTDRFWLETKDKNLAVVPDLSLQKQAAANTVGISGGNIFSPHTMK